MKKQAIAVLFSLLPACAATPAEAAIRKAREEVAKRPAYSPSFNALAIAYLGRARETSDAAFLVKAEETLKRSFALAPDNYEGLKVQACVLLGRHEFAKARELSNKLNRLTPDDVMVYGYLADANMELGNYKEAVDNVQWMLNLRPGNAPGLTRAASLRELHGDIEGAIDLTQRAYDASAYQEIEERAWLLTQMSRLNLAAGRLTEAETFANGALGVFPDYQYALDALGRIRVTQKRYDEAVSLFRKRYDEAPRAANLFAPAEALEQAGRHEEAARAFADFERRAMEETDRADNANRELAAYYTDYAHQPEKARQIAEREAGRRHDAFTLDAYAWSLAATGDFAHANSEMQKALAFGLKDPKVLEHARIIAGQGVRSAL